MKFQHRFFSSTILFLFSISFAACSIEVVEKSNGDSGFKPNANGVSAPVQPNSSPIAGATENSKASTSPSLSAAPEAGCLVTGNGADGGSSNIAAQNIAIKATKQKCANVCNTIIRSLVFFSDDFDSASAQGCSYSCQWDGKDIVERYSHSTKCLANTADPF